MPGLTAAEFLVGLAMVGLALIDVFSTILIPGPSNSPVRLGVHLRDLILPLWRHLALTRAGGRRQRLSNLFAPLLFAALFGTWIVLLVAGFGLMLHASAAKFAPPLDDLSQAFYVAGSSLLTLGVSEVDASGYARWLILWAALSGFGVITAAVTYVLQVQNSLHQRESGVLTLSGMAGKPPSGIALLEAFATLRLQSELRAFFRDWRDWSAAILHSHVSYPALAYFHSVDTESDWLSALHAVLDAATLVMGLTEDEARGSAALMHRAGSRTVAHLCDLFDLDTKEEVSVAAEEIEALRGRLERAGYATRPRHASDVGQMQKLRSDYAERLILLSAHLGAERTTLLPQGETDR